MPRGFRLIFSQLLDRPKQKQTKPFFQVTPGSAVDGPYDVDEYFYEMAKINKNWPTKDQLPMSKVRKWLDQHFRDLIPDDALRAYVLTNLNRKGQNYRKATKSQNRLTPLHRALQTCFALYRCTL